MMLHSVFSIVLVCLASSAVGQYFVRIPGYSINHLASYHVEAPLEPNDYLNRYQVPLPRPLSNRWSPELYPRRLSSYSLGYGRSPIVYPVWPYPELSPAYPPVIAPPQWTPRPIPRPGRQPLRRCRSVGLYQHPTDCRRFVRCRYDQLDGVFIYSERICPDGLAWDPELESCNYISRVPNCQRPLGSGGMTGSENQAITQFFPTKSRPVVFEEIKQAAAQDPVHIDNSNNEVPDEAQISMSSSQENGMPPRENYAEVVDRGNEKNTNNNKTKFSSFVPSDRYQPSASQLVGGNRKSGNLKRSNNIGTSRSTNLAKPTTQLPANKIVSTKPTPIEKGSTPKTDYELHATELDGDNNKK